MNDKKSIVHLLIRLKKYISIRRQRQLITVAILMVCSSILDVLSLGTLLPFLAVLMVPDRLLHNHIMAPIISFFHITSASQLLLPLTIIFIVTAIVSGIVRTFFTWVSNKVIFMCGADISIQVYQNILYQPYKTHVQTNSSDMISSIFMKANSLVPQILQPLLMFFNALIMLICMLSLLLAVNPTLALSTFLSFGACYLLLTKLSRAKLKSMGKIIAEENIRAIKTVQEGLGGIRDILLDNSQQVYCDTFRQADLKSRNASAYNTFVGISPRFMMETLIMLMIAIISIILSQRDGGLSKYVPMLGILALGAQRILPALQQLYMAWATIIGATPALHDTVQVLEQPLPNNINSIHKITPLDFKHSIELVNAKFSYMDNDVLVLNNFNLSIPQGARVGFVGRTGSGKSTTLDIIMGLLPLSSGKLLIDKQELDATTLKQWQANIAHVPQSIFLADTTFAGNIAFSIKPELIDMDRVKKVAQQAQIAEFIESRPDKYATYVGERGIRLSGGQRQRLGIARALYKQAKILIFDEATSALDHATEQAVMQAINNLRQDFTILIIAHRLNTVRNCDIIVEMANGQVVAQGTYDELLHTSASFANVVQELMGAHKK